MTHFDQQTKKPISNVVFALKQAPRKKLLKGYSKVHELKLVSIGLASPEKIQSWAEKQLPNGKIFGEVKNANTFHYRTFQPTKGGLFCERIFGPLKDFECACGKRQKPTAFESKKILEHKQTTRYFCSNCDVEYTWSIIRRYQLGYIKFNAPVTHLWYLKTNPSYLSIFFDMKRKDLESIIYCIDSLTIENMWKLQEQKANSSLPISDLYKIWENSLNFDKQKNKFQKTFQTKKKKNKIFRKKLFRKSSLALEFHQFSISHQKKIFQNVFEEKQKKILSLTFEKIFQKVCQKRYGNQKFLFFDFFTNFQFFDKFVLFQKNFQKNFFLKKNSFDSFFFYLKYSFSFVSATLNFEKVNQFDFFEKKNIENKKKILLFLFTMILFFKKMKYAEKKNFQKQKFQKGTFFKKMFFDLQMRCAEAKFSFEEKNKFLSSFLQPVKNEKDFSYKGNTKPYFVSVETLSLNIQKISSFDSIVEVFFDFQKQKQICPGFINLYLQNMNIQFFPFQKNLKDQKKHFDPNSSTLVKKKKKIEIFNAKNKLKMKKIQKKKQIKFQTFQKFGNIECSLKYFSPFFSDFFKNQQTQQIHKNKKFQNFKFSAECLKNPVQTICHNFLWKNDADWNAFLYYNSFFFSDFQDIPIFYFSSRGVFSSTKFRRELQHLNTVPALSLVETANLSSRLGPGMRTNFLHQSLLNPQNKYGIEDFLSFEASKKKMTVGAGILEKFLIEYTSIELKKIIKQHQILLPKLNQAIRFLKQTALTKKESIKIQKYLQKREHILRRLKFLQKFSRKNSNPTFMILRNLPVLPPDLRPILKLQNQIAASDLNRFYQRILYRNERLKKFSKDSVTNQSFEIKYAQRLLQEAVDNLIQNGKGGVKPETNSRGQPLKSLSEILKGKQGRFRQYLLGKRVDYSGRSVIVVGPKLKLHECGLPKEMAFELFLPFLIQRVLQLNFTKTVIGAKNLLKKDSDFAFHLLHKIMKNSPVLLNRAPTLHRLGFQAFLPKLVEGRAILLHPMVCPGFNADFDGDQMAVHIPLTVEARTEAWKFMLSTNNFINSATGEPILLPTQDMVLGCYYLTTDFQSKAAAFQIFNAFKKKTSFLSEKTFSNFQISTYGAKSFLFFHNISEVFSAYSRKEIGLHTPIWIRWKSFVDFGKIFTKPIEIQVQKNGYWNQIHSKFTTFHNEKNEIYSKYVRTTPGRILMNLMLQDFETPEKKKFFFTS